MSETEAKQRARRRGWFWHGTYPTGHPSFTHYGASAYWGRSWHADYTVPCLSGCIRETVEEARVALIEYIEAYFPEVAAEEAPDEAN